MPRKDGGARRLPLRLIATEACRAAVNGAEFIARVRHETDLDLEVVDARRKRALPSPAAQGSPIRRPRACCCSTSAAGPRKWSGWMGAARRRVAERVRAWTSLPVGVVTLAERHGGIDVTREGFEAMVREVDGLLAEFVRGLQGVQKRGRFHLLGTSGTVTTIAGVHLDLPRYDRRRVDGLWMDNVDVADVMERLLGMSFRQRAANPCIGHERADLVLAGCAILESIRRAFRRSACASPTAACARVS